MKAYLKPEDEQEHKRMVKSLDMAFALWDIIHKMLKELEYMEDVGEHVTRDIVAEKIYDIINDHSIDLHELIT